MLPVLQLVNNLVLHPYLKRGRNSDHFVRQGLYFLAGMLEVRRNLRYFLVICPWRARASQVIAVNEQQDGKSDLQPLQAAAPPCQGRWHLSLGLA